MSELGETFAAWREMKQVKKELNLKQSTALLKDTAVKFESKNEGTHLIVESTKGKVDFWPSTGLWITRKGKRGRGVFALLEFMGVKL